jgi:BirA family transcriptional regulator, biotin operon repressor / biotin---[acetyl-CoA-carboxylase] ligase
VNQEFHNVMRAALDTQVENLVVLSIADSTHHLAKRLIEQVDEDDVPLRPTLIVAEEQTGGCGRESRKWQSPPGNLYLSLVSGSIDADVVPLLPMLAACASQRALASIGVPEVRIKWPNDLLVNGRKIAGLIIHVRHGDRVLATIGLGMNIEAAPRLGDSAIVEPTSVAEALGSGNFPERAAAIAVGFLEGLYEAMADPKTAIDHWQEHLVHRHGDPIRARLSNGEVVDGRFAGVSELGHLVVEAPGGLRTLSGGDVIER